jgi:hypothetical protein
MLKQSILDELAKMREIELYAAIDTYGGLVWRLRHDASRDFARGNLPEPSYRAMMDAAAENEEAVTAAVKQTVRFGVAQPFVDKERPVELGGGLITTGSEDYWKWFRWWKGYVESINDEQAAAIKKALTANEDVSMYRPEGDWR